MLVSAINRVSRMVHRIAIGIYKLGALVIQSEIEIVTTYIVGVAVNYLNRSAVGVAQGCPNVAAPGVGSAHANIDIGKDEAVGYRESPGQRIGTGGGAVDRAGCRVIKRLRLGAKSGAKK